MDGKQSIAEQRAEKCLQIIRQGDTRRVDSYLRSQPEITHVEVAGQPLLSWASREGNPEMVLVLTRHGANVNQRDIMGQTALHIAASRGYQAVVEVLISAGADKTIKDYDGFTAIDWAKGKPEIEQLLSSTERIDASAK